MVTPLVDPNLQEGSMFDIQQDNLTNTLGLLSYTFGEILIRLVGGKRLLQTLLM